MIWHAVVDALRMTWQCALLDMKLAHSRATVVDAHCTSFVAKGPLVVMCDKWRMWLLRVQQRRQQYAGNNMQASQAYVSNKVSWFTGGFFGQLFQIDPEYGAHTAAMPMLCLQCEMGIVNRVHDALRCWPLSCNNLHKLPAISTAISTGMLQSC